MPAQDRWWLQSAIIATVTVALILVVAFFPDHWATWVVFVWFGVFVVAYSLNPTHRYWRLGVLVVSGWLGSRAVPTLAVFGTMWREGTLGLVLSNDVGPAFDVAAVILAVCLFLLDAHSRVPSPQGQWLKAQFGLRISAPRQSAEASAQQSQIGDIHTGVFPWGGGPTGSGPPGGTSQSMSGVEQFPYRDGNPSEPGLELMPDLPILLRRQSQSISATGLVDSGAPPL